MTSFYSLIKIAHNPASGDNLSIGIILNYESGFRCKFSKNKIEIAKKLLHDKSNSIDYIVKQISKKIKEVNDLGMGNSMQSLNQFTESYFVYLNKYCNGILQFSGPSKIFDQIDESKFEKLFYLLVDDNNKKVELSTKKDPIQTTSFYSRIKSNLIDRVKGKIHVNKKIDSNIVHSLINPFEMDCIGKNGSLIGAKSLPLNQSRQTIATHINTYMNVIFHLSDKFSPRNNNFFLISDEPETIGSPEHKIWESLIKEDKFAVINSEECYVIANKIEEKSAEKFLELN